MAWRRRAGGDEGVLDADALPHGALPHGTIHCCRRRFGIAVFSNLVVEACCGVPLITARCFEGLSIGFSQNHTASFLIVIRLLLWVWSIASVIISCRVYQECRA